MTESGSPPLVQALESISSLSPAQTTDAIRLLGSDFAELAESPSISERANTEPLEKVRSDKKDDDLLDYTLEKISELTTELDGLRVQMLELEQKPAQTTELTAVPEIIKQYIETAIAEATNGIAKTALTQASTLSKKLQSIDADVKTLMNWKTSLSGKVPKDGEGVHSLVAQPAPLEPTAGSSGTKEIGKNLPRHPSAAPSSSTTPGSAPSGTSFPSVSRQTVTPKSKKDQIREMLEQRRAEKLASRE